MPASRCDGSGDRRRVRRLTRRGRPRTGRWLRRFYPLVVFLAFLPACVNVDPSADYDRTTELARARTGAGRLYDPRLDEREIQAAVDSMLSGGLSVDEAVRVALLGNRQLQSLFLQVGATRAELVGAGLFGNPSLGLSVRFPDGGGLTSITVDLAQNILDLLLVPIRRRMAEARLAQARLEAARRAIELVAEVRSVAYELLGIKEAERLAGEDLDLVRRSVHLAEDRLAAGEGDRLDLELARREALDLEAERLGLVRDREVAHAALGRLLGLSSRSVTWELAGDLPSVVAALGRSEAGARGDDALVRRALARRLEVRIADLEIEAARAARSKASRDLFDGVTLGAELERPEAPPTLIGPTLEGPLPVWHQNQAAIAEADALIARRLKDYQAVLDQVADDVRRAAATLRGEARLVRFYEDTVLPQARSLVEIARRSYEAGERDMLALIEAQRHLVTSRHAHLEILRRYASALADLERATGGSITHPPPAADRAADQSGDAGRFPEEAR